MAKVNDEYILANFGHMTQREMALHFDVSVSTINRHCKRLGLREDTPIPARPKVKVIDFTQDNAVASDDLKRLEELRDIVYKQICQSKGTSVAALSKEYREILTEIRMLEGGGDESDIDVFDQIAASFAERKNRVSATNL